MSYASREQTTFTKSGENEWWVCFPYPYIKKVGKAEYQIIDFWNRKGLLATATTLEEAKKKARSYR